MSDLEASKVGRVEVCVGCGLPIQAGLIRDGKTGEGYHFLCLAAGQESRAVHDGRELETRLVAEIQIELAAAHERIQALRDWAWNADVESRPAHVVCSCNRVGAMHEPTCPISLWVNLTGQLNGTIRAILGPSPVFHPEPD